MPIQTTGMSLDRHALCPASRMQVQMTSHDTPSSQYLRVMVVDDHPAVREALANIIADEVGLELAGVVSTEAEARELASAADVAVIDISLEDGDGLVLVSELRRKHPDLQIVVFSMHDEMVFGEPAINAGASSYLMKAEPTHLVVEAIRRVARGEIYVSQRLAARLLSRLVRRGGLPDAERDDASRESEQRAPNEDARPGQ